MCMPVTTVEADFTIPAGQSGKLSLVSYTAPQAYFDANTASQQKVFDFDTETFGPGDHSMTVKVPTGNFQVDFVCGRRDHHFRPGGQQPTSTMPRTVSSVATTAAPPSIPARVPAVTTGLATITAVAETTTVVPAATMALATITAKVAVAATPGAAMTMARVARVAIPAAPRITAKGQPVVAL